ncbi:hypothetical protein [Citrobacter freundii]|uniref:tail fiber/spike domain-containing protein n=1 Tax=Citrobacter freundii TaxID=546 RepID=UPI0023B23FBE|nr:hypothetical protein [Citrobacter freundii]MDE9605269.1 hypothetical protein [Citrobacter freundii]
MTVSTEVDHNEYTGNGVTTSFPYTFRIFKKSDLVVQVVDLSENIIDLVLDTDYTVTGAGGYTGGNVVLSSPLANGYQISISRELPVTQETDLRNQGKFFAEVHEDAFDKLTMLIQQAISWLRLSLRKPSFVANYYDALNNYIRNLRDPSRPQDAATKNYVDNLSVTNSNRAIRVPEPFISSLPDIDGRKNKSLSFDNAGEPLLLDPAQSGLWGYVLIDSFQLGANITTRFQALHWSLPDGNGEYYRWDGALPKIVDAGSIPTTTGGVGIGAWVSVGDASLRVELSSSADGKGSSLIAHGSWTVFDELNSRLPISRFVDTTGVLPADDGLIEALAYSAAHGLTLDITGKVRITKTVKQPPNSSVDCRNGVIFCEDPSGLENGLMWLVDESGIPNEKTTRIGTLILSTSPVIGEGLIVDRDVMGLVITTPKIVVENVYTYGCRLGGVKTGPKGYEITIKTATCWITSWTDKSKWGIDLSAADGINGSLVCVGYARGIRSSGTNHIDFTHPWGFPATSGNEYQNRQLLTALSLDSNTHVTHCYLDSVDTEGYDVAQSGNDGVNIVFNGYNSTIDKCFILVHGQTKPGKVKLYNAIGTQNTISNLMVNNDSALGTPAVIYQSAVRKWQNHVLGGNVTYLTNRFTYPASSLIAGGGFTGNIEFRKEGTDNIRVTAKITCTYTNITDAYFGISLPDGLDIDNTVGNITSRNMLASTDGNQTLINFENNKIYPIRQSEAAGSYVYFAKDDVRLGNLNFVINALNTTAGY